MCAVYIEPTDAPFSSYKLKVALKCRLRTPTLAPALSSIMPMLWSNNYSERSNFSVSAFNGAWCLLTPSFAVSNWRYHSYLVSECLLGVRTLFDTAISLVQKVVQKIKTFCVYILWKRPRCSFAVTTSPLFQSAKPSVWTQSDTASTYECCAA